MSLIKKTIYVLISVAIILFIIASTVKADTVEITTETLNLRKEATTESDIKGSLNDSNLSVIGFKNYSMEYETYALTRLILFVMTGKTNLEKIKDNNIRNFVLKGTNGDVNKRYKSINEMVVDFNKIF